MPREILWRKTIGAQMGGITLALLALSVLLIVGNLTILASIQGDSASLNLFLKGRYYSYEMLALANRLFDEQDEKAKTLTREKLNELMAEMDQRFERLAGDHAIANDPLLLAGLRERKNHWQKIREMFKELSQKQTRDKVKNDLFTVADEIDKFAQHVDEGGQDLEKASEARVSRFKWLQFAFGAVVFIVLGFVFWITRGIANRSRLLANTADRIAGGDLTISADVKGSDELAALGDSFNTMTTNLRATIETEKGGRARIDKLLDAEKQRRERIERLLATIREAVNRLSTSSTEILASTSQQAAGAQEQAAAVSETVTTVDEVTQTAEQSAQRAKSVGEAVVRTQEIGKSGRKTVDDSIAALGTVKEQVEATAENILALAEQAQAIGEIIATVNDIAEQTNLLALNAAIEASRAGEHGKGFSVVAGEVKALADQSKKATAQVRQRLGEIQKATNTAVLSTEEVTKGVATATRVADQAGQTIKALADTLAEAAQAAAQIVASAGQQATGMAQIHQAMKNIDQVARQNLAAMRQAELAAQNLNALGTELAGLSAE